jgi:hypothetical protein
LKCLDDRDAREPNRTNLIRRIKDTSAGVLPLSRILLGVRKFADICSDLEGWWRLRCPADRLALQTLNPVTSRNSRNIK